MPSKTKQMFGRFNRKQDKREWPFAGELRNPCVVLKTTRQPDMTWGFDMKVDKVAQPWCRIDYTESQYVEDVNEGTGDGGSTEATHMVWCRKNDAWAPKKDYFIVHKTEVLRILKAKQIDQRLLYWKIWCVSEGALADYGYDNVDTPQNPHDATNPEDEPADSYEGFPLYK